MAWGGDVQRASQGRVLRTTAARACGAAPPKYREPPRAASAVGGASRAAHTSLVYIGTWQ